MSISILGIEHSHDTLRAGQTRSATRRSSSRAQKEALRLRSDQQMEAKCACSRFQNLAAKWKAPSLRERKGRRKEEEKIIR